MRAFIFLLLGYGTKVGLAPLHAWLPDAHAEGPTPISAVLSGLLLNVALYALLRFKVLLAANPHAIAIAAAAKALVDARDRWLNPPELVDIVPEVVPGFPDRIVPRNPAAAAILKKRTLTNLYNTRGTPEGAWLDNLHRALDAAVAAAYGWPADISTDEALARLLALNHARAPARSQHGAPP